MPVSLNILYVGRGDCIVIEFSTGQLVMVDVNRVANASDPVDYLKTNYPDEQLSLFVLTHPHAHRLTGLSQIRQQVGFVEFWDIEHNYEPTYELESDAFKTDWEDYQKIRSGGYPEIKVSRPKRGYKFVVSEKEGLEVMAPTEELQKRALREENYHLAGYVLRVKCGENCAIIGGSASSEVWEDIYNYYGSDLGANLLIAPHHGHRDGYYQPAVKAIHPEFVVISSEAEQYADAAGYYSRFCTSGIVSTAHLGNIIASCFPSGGVELRTQY